MPQDMTAMCERGATPTQLRRTRPADARHASSLRCELDAWLRDAAPALPEYRCADVLLGVNEALANCAEHAYRGRANGDITMHATYDDAAHRIRVRISDRGRWRLNSVAQRNRGRGIALMHALADHCTVDRDGEGTTVLLDYDVAGDLR